MHESGSQHWWKHMKKLMGLDRNVNYGMQGLTNETANGDCGLLANIINEFFVSVSEN